jgi:NAD(P)-dependent dehydrogenase (short-subunit alcohol dehydrogenase family)
MARARGNEFGARGWTADRLPELGGKTCVVTGANSGIGYEAARMLGARGATVFVLARNRAKAEAALESLKKAAPKGAFEFTPLDLQSLASVREAAAGVRRRVKTIDALIFNAGIMMLPKRELTADGFETQFGVNHLGHFALGGLIADLVESAGGRFVSVASIAHRYSQGIRFDDVNLERGYTAIGAYTQSKLANLMFALELDRRLAAAGKKSRAYVCHPGYSDTNLQSTGPSRIAAAVFKPLTAMLSQPASKGALPTVLCAAGAEAKPGRYYGPNGFREMTGPVGEASVARRARDANAATRLWELSEKLTGVKWGLGAGF